jgi:hypothetical protein
MMQVQLESDSLVLVKAFKYFDYNLSAHIMFREAKFLLDTQFIFLCELCTMFL